jgi:hypothetical protein
MTARTDDHSTTPSGASAVRRPNLVLAGVTKAGTTSLVQYLGQHPDISIIPGKGVDHFTPLRFGAAELPPVEEYLAPFAGLDTPWVLDGSITYFTGGARLVDALHGVLPDARILVSLRDPVDRLWSAYKMKRSQGVLPSDVRDVGEFVDRCEELAATGEILEPEHVVFRTWATGMYVDHLAPWWDRYGDRVRVMFFEDLAADPRATMAGLLEWLGLDPADADAITYTVRNRSVHHRSPRLRRWATRTFRANWDFLVRHQRVTAALGRAYRAVNARDFDETFPPSVRARVAAAYAPATARLADALRARGQTELPDWLASAGTPSPS